MGRIGYWNVLITLFVYWLWKKTYVLHWENYICISFHSEWDMIVVTVFEPNGISIWFKNCPHDHIPFTEKGNVNIVFSVKLRTVFIHGNQSLNFYLELLLREEKHHFVCWHLCLTYDIQSLEHFLENNSSVMKIFIFLFSNYRNIYVDSYNLFYNVEHQKCSSIKMITRLKWYEGRWL